MRLDPARNLVSIDGIHKNVNLPPRSTGTLLAEGLSQIGWLKPAILEGYNVERKTVNVLIAGGSGQGTRIGDMLEDAALALGGVVVHWEPISSGTIWHLRVHLAYP